MDSITKVWTSFAAVKATELGLLSLDDPIEKFIPPFQNMTVVSADGSTVPAKRPPTVRDCLTHVAGLAVSMDQLGVSGPWSAYRTEEYVAFSREATSARTVAMLSQQPLSNHPGERFVYGRGHVVAGHVVEVVSGVPLFDFLRRYFLEPAGMGEDEAVSNEPINERQASLTMPSCSPTNVGNFCSSRMPLCERQATEASMTVQNGSSAGCKCSPPMQRVHPPAGFRRILYGDDGLLCTARVMMSFLRMLGAGGVAPNGVRILSDRHVALMANTNQLPGNQYFPADLVRHARTSPRWPNVFNGSDGAGRPVALDNEGAAAFALGGYLTTERSAAVYESRAVRAGQYGWVGWHGVCSVVDFTERLQLLVMTQQTLAFFMPELRVPIGVGAPGVVMESVYDAITRRPQL